jgi:hypothetical protein
MLKLLATAFDEDQANPSHALTSCMTLLQATLQKPPYCPAQAEKDND